MQLVNRALVAALPALPRSIVHLVAKRYVAGTTLDDALSTVARLNGEGACATIDVLGEDITRPSEAEATRDAYIRALREVAARKLDSNVSVKLTGLGLKLDVETCLRNVAAVCEEAKAHGSFVRIDMEDSSLTDVTLQIWQRLRAEGHANVGPVLQAMLRRTVADARAIAAPGVSVRLCKGIYREPRSIAWQDREIVRRNYAWILKELWSRGAHVGVATHDELLTWEAQRIAGENGVEPARFEYQMLLGVEDDLRMLLLSQGHRVRVYVPFGERWYEYSMRRLKENPEVAGHVARATIGRLFSGSSTSAR